MAFSSDQVWGEFFKELVNVALPNYQAGSTDQAVAIAGTTLYADVANTDAQISAESVYSFGNLLPSADPSYAPGGDLVGSYSLFLQNIDLGGDTNPNLLSQINIAAGKVTAAQQNYSAQQLAAYQAFAAYKSATGDTSSTFDIWANQNYPVLAAAKTALDGATADYNQLMVQAHGAGFADLNAAQAACSYGTGCRKLTANPPYNMPAKVGTLQPPGSESTLPGQNPPPPANSLTSLYRPAFSLGGGFTNVYSTWQTASAQGNYGHSFTLKATDSAANYEHYGWSASAKASYRSWFSVKASAQASYDSVSYDWSDSTFECTISFNGIGSFAIGGDTSWFNVGMIQNYKDKLLSSAPQFFGEGGSLHVIPSSLILGFGPKISIKVNNANYSSLKTAFQQSASLSIGVGPFSFGGSESSFDRTSSFTYHDDSTTIDIVPPPTTVPLLLGVVCNKY